jgi:3-dehydroquinate dehydratase / shikimate dehydrogenase
LATATLIASLAEAPTSELLEQLPPAVEWLEVRADRVGDLDVPWLREHFDGGLLYTLRSSAEGGSGESSPRARAPRLAAAAEHYDLVDLEAERDLTPELLAAVNPERRVVSWHGPVGEPERLTDRLEAMSATPARLYKLVTEVRIPGDEVAPLRLLGRVRRDDVVAFAGGEAGVWTRLVAPRLGARWVYGAAGSSPAAPGQPAVTRLTRDFGLPDLPAVRALCGVVGVPVLHSLSPRLHNAAYRALGLPYLYLPFHTERFGDFWLEVVEGGTLEELGLPLHGLSVTAPFKGAALAVAGAASPLGERLGAVNTLVLRDGVWEGESTDGNGVLWALERRGVSIAGKAAAVVGCGRAGRAAAFALCRAGAQVTLVNRSVSRGEEAARDLELPFVPLEELETGGFDLLVHATALGRVASDPLPFDVESLSPESAVVDLVYGPTPTPLEEAVRGRGLVFVAGREVLLGQARGQFYLMTGHELPLEVGLAALELEGVVA